MAFTVKPFVSARPVVVSRPVIRVAPVRASKVAEPAVLAVKAFDGADAGTASLALKVAGDDTARHVVHRYLVMVRQNARGVCFLLKSSMLAENSRLWDVNPVTASWCRPSVVIRKFWHTNEACLYTSSLKTLFYVACSVLLLLFVLCCVSALSLLRMSVISSQQMQEACTPFLVSSHAHRCILFMKC